MELYFGQIQQLSEIINFLCSTKSLPSSTHPESYRYIVEMLIDHDEQKTDDGQQHNDDDEKGERVLRGRIHTSSIRRMFP
jgi:hypothetical protein